MDKIGVFCSATEDLPAHYREAAAAFGQWLGERHKTLVYGGSSRGLMGDMGRACHAAGGQLYGMVPFILEERGWVEPDLDVTFPCEGLTDRKELMMLESEAFVALPGGIGTLDEVFTVLGQASIGLAQKRVFLLNLDGFYDTLIAFLQELADKAFVRQPLDAYFMVARSVDELVKLMEEK